MMDWYGGMGAWGWLMMTAFWVLVIALAVALTAQLFPRGGRRDAEPQRQDTSLGILERRFAEGEIDVDEYLRVRDALLAGRK